MDSFATLFDWTSDDKPVAFIDAEAKREEEDVEELVDKDHSGRGIISAMSLHPELGHKLSNLVGEIEKMPEKTNRTHFKASLIEDRPSLRPKILH